MERGVTQSLCQLWDIVEGGAKLAFTYYYFVLSFDILRQRVVCCEVLKNVLLSIAIIYYLSFISLANTK